MWCQHADLPKCMDSLYPHSEGKTLLTALTHSKLCVHVLATSIWTDGAQGNTLTTQRKALPTLLQHCHYPNLQRSDPHPPHPQPVVHKSSRQQQARHWPQLTQNRSAPTSPPVPTIIHFFAFAPPVCSGLETWIAAQCSKRSAVRPADRHHTAGI